MKVVALTGGIGSGKSLVSKMLSRNGVPVYDCDSATKKLYARDDTLLDSIEEAFGCGIRNADGSVNKEKLASIIFSSPQKRAVLEEIVHPVVLRDFMRWKAMQDSIFEERGDLTPFYGNQPFVVMESAIILSKPDFLSHVSKVVLVDASLSTRLSRVCQRDQTTPDKVIERMAAQRFDISKVNATIKNDGSIEELEEAVRKVFGSLAF